MKKSLSFSRLPRILPWGAAALLLACSEDQVKEVANQAGQTTSCPSPASTTTGTQAAQTQQPSQAAKTVKCGTGTEEKNGECFPNYPLVTCGTGTKAQGTATAQECVAAPTDISGTYSVTETVYNGACSDGSVVQAATQGKYQISLTQQSSSITGTISGITALSSSEWTILEQTKSAWSLYKDGAFGVQSSTKKKNASLGWEAIIDANLTARTSGNSLSGYGVQSIKLSSKGILIGTCTVVSTVEGSR